MKPPDQTAQAFTDRRRAIPRRAMLLGLLVCALGAQAQDVVAPPPAEDVIPSALLQAQAAQNNIVNAAVPAFAPDTPVLQSGPITVRTHFFYRLLYGDGIPVSSGQHLTTAIQNISPELLVDLGTHWTFDYTPTWVIYSNSAFTNSVDESVQLAGWTTYEDWTLHLTQSYVTSSSPLIETGAQTKQETWQTDFNGVYSLNSVLALELGAAQSIRIAHAFTDSREWSTTDWLHYKYAPRLDTAVGIAFGYEDVSQGLNMSYNRPEAKVTWDATDKISLNVHGGVENRRFIGAGASEQHNPIYGASILYQPIETTKVTIETDREVAASYFENQITKSTNWSLQLEQRLLKEFYLSAGLARQKVSYVSSVGGAATVREDDNYSVNVRLSTVIFRRCTLAAVYQDSHNSSTLAGYGVSSSQIGFEFGYRY